MAIKQFSKSNVEGGVRSSKFWDNETYIGDFEWLGTVTISSTSVVSFSFTNIPQNFTHLQVRSNFRQDGSENLFACFNTDTDNITPSYNRHYTYHAGNTSGTGTSGGDTGSLGAGNFGWTPSTSAALFTASGILDIFDYSSTNKWKTTKTQLGSAFPNLTPATTSQGANVFYEGIWWKTDVIRSITMQTDNKAKYFDTGSRFDLYGWR